MANVLITGAARGLGAELSRHWPQEDTLYLLDVDKNSLHQLTHELQSRGQEVHSLHVDLLQDSNHDWVAKLPAVLDVLVHNAGIVFGGAFHQVTWNQHSITLNLNLQTPIRLTHQLWPQIMASQSPEILFISSASSLIGFPFASSYAASKWGLSGFAESLRLEALEQKRPLKVTVICPSYIRTELFDGARAPRLFPYLEPKSLASWILKRRDGRVHYAPLLVRALPLLLAVVPQKVRDSLMNLLGVQQGMKHWRGRS
jgi:short-subunit dehydrogenase